MPRCFFFITRSLLGHGEVFTVEFFLVRAVIACTSPHIYKWLNLLLGPRRHLQRLGFVSLGSMENACERKKLLLSGGKKLLLFLFFVIAHIKEVML